MKKKILAEFFCLSILFILGVGQIDVCIVLFYFISAAVQVDDTITAYFGQDVDLPCILTEFLEEIVQIEWIKRKKTEIKIYTIVKDGTTRPEDVNGLKGRLKFAGNPAKGVGTIQLQKAEVKDEAVYICRIILFENEPVVRTIQLLVRGKINLLLYLLCTNKILLDCYDAYAIML